MALENARLFDETQRLLAETDRRAAELAIINSVQEGLAAQLDMQAMYELVGERASDVFDAQVVDIAHLRPRRRNHAASRTPSSAACGSRTSRGRSCGFRKHVDRDGRARCSSPRTCGRARPRAGQPAQHHRRAGEVRDLRAADRSATRSSGVISLQNLDREHAFSERDVSLLTTLAASLSVALRNGRLVDETRQRAAELGDRSTSVGEAHDGAARPASR